MNFMDALAAGLTRTRDIDDDIAEWHLGDSEVSLHEFLGMSWETYARWVENPESLEAYGTNP